MVDLSQHGPAKAEILTILRGGPQTARDVASRLRVQVSAARKHLERLVELGIVREQFVREGRGRPKKYYSLTEEGLEVFPRRYDAVLEGLLTTIVERRGEESAREILAQLADRIAQPIARAKAGRAARTLDLLNDLAFDVSAERSDGRLTLTSRNCPILRVARAHGELVCSGLHSELIRRALKAKRVTRGKWIPSGDSVCTHMVDA